VDLSNLGERRSKSSQLEKKSCFKKMLYPEQIYQHTVCNMNNVLAYVRRFLNILNKDCENFDLKLLESVTLPNAVKSANLEFMSKQLFLRFRHDYRMINFEAKIL
jgi:hypothetical protein